MIREQYDKQSGAILFKKDPDSLRYEELLSKVKEMEKELKWYKKTFKKIEDKLAEFEQKLNN